MLETAIPTTTPMLDLKISDADWAGVSQAEAEQMLFSLYSVRRFEEAILALDKQGLVHGPAHSSIGQDGGAVGAMAALPHDALMTGTHRAHHQVMAKLVRATWSDNFRPNHDTALPDKMEGEMNGMLSEILGLKGGWGGGRGGSMHLRRDEIGVLGTNAIVAGGTPIACGAAWAEKINNTGRVTITFFGDGATHQGTTHESLNLAALYNLPIIFFLENNGYAVSMTPKQSTREQNLLTRALGHGIPSVRCDGMDPMAVRRATERAYEMLLDEDGRPTRGPVLIQADVYRYYHQSTPIPGSAFGYRTKDEEDSWRARDPIDRFIKDCLERKVLSQADVDAIEKLATATIDKAVDTCVEGQGSERRIRPELWPDPATIDDGITGDLSEVKGLRAAEPEDFRADEMVEMKFIDAMPQVVLARMKEDPRYMIIGEDVANMRGGTVGATKGIIDAFPDRVVNTPICENGFCGLAAGLATRGMRPIIELMYSDFMLVAADQLLNQIGKMRHLFGGHYPVPVVLRTRIPGAEGYGSQHSMDPAGVFMQYPGWRIIAPANAFEYVGLMNSALLCDDPVLVLEHQSLHRTTSMVPKNFDYLIPLGKARYVRRGTDMTIIATMQMIRMVEAMCDELGISADIIDPRTLSQRDIDYDLIGESIARTNNVVIAEQSTRGTSIGAFLSDEIQRRFFYDLDQPIRRVTGNWAPPPVSKVLESAALAGPDHIRPVLRDALATARANRQPRAAV